MFAKPLAFFANYGILAYDIWVWRSMVARYLGVVEAASSSLVTQTMAKAVELYCLTDFAFDVNEFYLMR